MSRQETKRTSGSGQIVGTLLLLLAAVIWGSAFVAQSVGAEHVDAFTFLALRSWLGFLVLLPVIAALDKGKMQRGLPTGKPRTAAEKNALWRGGIACGVLLFIASLIQQLGIAYTTTAKAGFLTALYVLFVPLAVTIYTRKAEGRLWICCVLAVVGLYFLCLSGGLYLTSGDTLELLCAVFFAAHILTAAHFSPGVDGVRLSCIQFLVEAILATIGMLFFGHPDLMAIRSALPSILYAGLLSSGAGYTLQIVGQSRVPPAIASLVMSLESVFSALAGWVILGQALSGREIFGCCLMFAAIILAQMPKRSPAEADATEE